MTPSLSWLAQTVLSTAAAAAAVCTSWERTSHIKHFMTHARCKLSRCIPYCQQVSPYEHLYLCLCTRVEYIFSIDWKSWPMHMVQLPSIANINVSLKLNINEINILTIRSQQWGVPGCLCSSRTAWGTSPCSWIWSCPRWLAALLTQVHRAPPGTCHSPGRTTHPSTLLFLFVHIRRDFINPRGAVQALQPPKETVQIKV